MEQHWLEVEGGDEVLIDLGGYGLVIELDSKKRFYDVEYVTIEYDEEDGSPATSHLPADMIVKKFKRKTTVEQADEVRIWRHEKP